MSTFQSTFDVNGTTVKAEFVGVSRTRNLKFKTFLVYRGEEPIFLREIIISPDKYGDRFQSTVLYDIKGIVGRYQRYRELGVEPTLAVLLAQADKHHQLVFNRLAWKRECNIPALDEHLLAHSDGSSFIETLLSWLMGEEDWVSAFEWLPRLLPAPVEPETFSIRTEEGVCTLEFWRGRDHGKYCLSKNPAIIQSLADHDTRGVLAICRGYSGTWVEQGQYIHWLLLELRKKIKDSKENK